MASAAGVRHVSSQPVLPDLRESLISVSSIFAQEKTRFCSDGAADTGYFKVTTFYMWRKKVNLREADVKGFCQGSADTFTGARPLFSSLFSFDDRLDLNFKALLEESPALTVVLCDELLQIDVSVAF